MPRKNLTSDQAAFDRMETTKRDLLAAKIQLEAQKTGQTMTLHDARTGIDRAVAGEAGAEGQDQFRTALDEGDSDRTKRVKVRLETQQALGNIEAIQHGQRTNPVIDVLDSPRFAKSILEQVTAGVPGDVALNRARGSAGEQSQIDFLQTATEDEASDAMTNPVTLESRPDDETGRTDYGSMSIEELNAQMVREGGSPAQQRHQASLDRAAAAATPEARLLAESGGGPQPDPTDYDSMSAEQLDDLLMKESGQTDPRSGRYETSTPGVTVSVRE